MSQPTLLVTVAHPDDESFGCSAVIARSAVRGWRVVVCCASRGEAGEDVSGGDRSDESLADAREAELRAAGAILGVDEIEVLGLADSGWDGPGPDGSLVDAPETLHAAVAATLTRHRPSVVVTMDPTGSDGHRDHAAIGQATTAAFGEVVDWPASLYHWCLPRSLMRRWAREIASGDPDSVYLGAPLGRPDDDVTTVVDAGGEIDRCWRAIAAHTTQASPYANVSKELSSAFVSRDHLIRIIPRWSGGDHEASLLAPTGPSPAS